MTTPELTCYCKYVKWLTHNASTQTNSVCITYRFATEVESTNTHNENYSKFFDIECMLIQAGFKLSEVTSCVSDSLNAVVQFKNRFCAMCRLNAL